MVKAVMADVRHLREGAAQRDELYKALMRVEQALASSSKRAGWPADVAAALADLRQRFDVHIDVTEREGGAYDQILEAAPRLTHAVQAMQAEHAEISDAIDDALGAMQGTPDPGDVRESLTHLLTSLVRHRQRGADLLYEAYEVDVGALD